MTVNNFRKAHLELSLNATESNQLYGSAWKRRKAWQQKAGMVSKVGQEDPRGSDYPFQGTRQCKWQFMLHPRPYHGPGKLPRLEALRFHPSSLSKHSSNFLHLFTSLKTEEMLTGPTLQFLFSQRNDKKIFQFWCQSPLSLASMSHL